MSETALLTAWETPDEPASQPNLMWWLALSRVSGLGPVRTSQLLENLGALELMQRYDESVWARLEAAAA